ncbi:hypothetical protein ACH0B5_05090 [Ureibacillus sp. 179-F W5.1 NHS]|uniref:Alpha-ribazole-5-phosphate synthase n=1 Tax=Lysinibacillus halotolerans TaxID=1368476 RepID=A0A3M8H7X4_9BACI|nr:hypothetical protein [Lysinibacillus halotolerans]RNC98200.1 hypothetical protein EC501_11965 [Lysinibacillus halotolerans]
MRNASKVDENTVVTMDNSGCIGEKQLDVVYATNEVTAYYTTRVALIEQWCAGAHPSNIFMANFTSDAAWDDYIKGIKRAFDEIEDTMPPIKGSTESNFQSLQSGLSLMMIGKIQFDLDTKNCDWYVIGKPLVGPEVIDEEKHVAKLKELYQLLKRGIIKQVWPVGSKGIQAELERIFPGKEVTCSLPLHKTSGPSTSVIVAVKKNEENHLNERLTTPYEKLIIT